MEFCAGRPLLDAARCTFAYARFDFDTSNEPRLVNLLDMEPPDGFGVNDYLIYANTATIAAISTAFNGTKTIRLRGGMNPNVDKKYAEIPALSATKFQWDGIPKIDFNEVVMFPLNAGLGSLSVNGHRAAALGGLPSTCGVRRQSS